MIAIKLLFWSLLFLFFAGIVGGPWFALAAYIALVVYGVTDTVRKARQLEQARANVEEATKRAQEARATADRLAHQARIAADRYAEASITNKLTDDGVALFTCPN